MRSNAPARIWASPVRPGGTAEPAGRGEAVDRGGDLHHRLAPASATAAPTAGQRPIAANSATIMPELCNAVAGAMILSNGSVSITPVRSPPAAARPRSPRRRAGRRARSAPSPLPYLSPSECASSGKSSCQRRSCLGRHDPSLAADSSDRDRRHRRYRPRFRCPAPRGFARKSGAYRGRAPAAPNVSPAAVRIGVATVIRRRRPRVARRLRPARTWIGEK